MQVVGVECPSALLFREFCCKAPIVFRSITSAASPAERQMLDQISSEILWPCIGAVVALLAYIVYTKAKKAKAQAKFLGLQKIVEGTEPFSGRASVKIKPVRDNASAVASQGCGNLRVM